MNCSSRTMLLIVTLLVGLLSDMELAEAQDIRAGFPPPRIRFTTKLLTVDANEGIDLADVNKDGQLDIISGRNWYPAPEFVPKPLRGIEDWNGYIQSNGDFACDVNLDGWIDVIAGSFLPTEVYWYENPGEEGLEFGHLWHRHLLVDTELSENEASFLHDLDRDGRPEWITNSWNVANPTVAWRLGVDFSEEPQNPDKPGDRRAITHVLQKAVIGVDGNGHGMGFGDINNDGREDILIGRGWYERPPGDIWKSPWKFHADWNHPGASCPMIVRDIDGDGVNDLIWGRGHDYGLFWERGLGPDEDGKLQFKTHQIDARYSQSHVIHFADLDGDGTDELITGKRVRAHNGRDPGGDEMPCMYYYRWDNKYKNFSRLTIDEGHIGTGLQIRTGDLNGDERTDIAVAGKDGTWILFNQGTVDSE